MSQKKNKGKKSKTIVATQTIRPTTSKRTSTVAAHPEEMIFNKSNYILMAAGVGLIILGMALMTGGSMPSPDVWDENIIYSTRITVLAPIVILAGLGVEIYAIFKK